MATLLALAAGGISSVKDPEMNMPTAITHFAPSFDASQPIGTSTASMSV
jgi:hypothetical protein